MNQYYKEQGKGEGGREGGREGRRTWNKSARMVAALFLL